MSSNWKAEAGSLNAPETKDLPISDDTPLTCAETTHTQKARRIAGGRRQTFLGQVRHTIGLGNLSKNIKPKGAPGLLPGLTAERTTSSEAGQTTGLATRRTTGLVGRRTTGLPHRRNSNLAQLVHDLGSLIPSDRKMIVVNNKKREIKTLSENLAVLRAAVTIMFPPARRRMIQKLKGLFAADKLSGFTRLLMPLTWRVSRTTFQSYRVP